MFKWKTILRKEHDCHRYLILINMSKELYPGGEFKL